MPALVGLPDKRGLVLAYIALGSNLGDAAGQLRQAVHQLGNLPLSAVSKCSSLYRTAPLDTDSGAALPAAGQDYLNAVIALNTGLSAPALLQKLQHIEQLAGRERSYRNAPRTLDLDVLLYGSGSMDSDQLTVPHPRMWQRAFVLVPLAEIALRLVSREALAAVGGQRIERAGRL